MLESDNYNLKTCLWC